MGPMFGFKSRQFNFLINTMFTFTLKEKALTVKKKTLNTITKKRKEVLARAKPDNRVLPGRCSINTGYSC